ncbi:hypothetical protein [Arthrobacter glacialis]|uniref:Uncharacterized protein n=1 Tax=Arthrobacter glacialis TaxID=1664 RepID=A0A2S3ZW24_ARTGL|nr:hypothetical protein [Arthrobacter glacialis]POH73461.1 hypothetical protein CVS27_11175 [Arthrobacter glacialis]
MAISRAYDPENRDQVFDTLRREILAAQVKVTLDKELNRPTSETVKRLAGMKLPPIVKMNQYICVAQADIAALKVQDIRAGRCHTATADEIGRDLGVDG